MGTGIELLQQGLSAIAVELQKAQAPRVILLGLDFSVLAQGAECESYLKRLESDRGGVWVEKRHITPIKVAITVRNEMQPYSEAEVIGYMLTVYAA